MDTLSHIHFCHLDIYKKKIWQRICRIYRWYIYPVDLTCEATICRIRYDLCGSKSHPFMATVRDTLQIIFLPKKLKCIMMLGGNVRYRPLIWNLLRTLPKGLDFSRFSFNENDPTIPFMTTVRGWHYKYFSCQKSYNALWCFRWNSKTWVP